MDQTVCSAVENIVSDQEIARGIGVAPALDVRGGVGVMPLLTPSVTRKAEDVIRDLAVFNDTAVLALVLIEKILDRVDAVFNEIADVLYIFQLKFFTVCCDLMRDSGIVDLINIAIFDYIIIARAVYFNAVSVAGNASASALGVVRIGAEIMLYRAADPPDLASRDMKSARA